MSTGTLAQKGVEVSFTQDSFKIIINRRHVAEGYHDGNLYWLDVTEIGLNAHVKSATSLQTWHEWMGHISPNALKTYGPSALTGMVLDASTTALDVCPGCELGKSTCKPFSASSSKRTTQILEVVHSDLASPMQTKSIQGSFYTVLWQVTYFFSFFYLTSCITTAVMWLTTLLSLIVSVHLWLILTHYQYAVVTQYWYFCSLTHYDSILYVDSGCVATHFLSEPREHEELVWRWSSWTTGIFSPYRENGVTGILLPTKSKMWKKQSATNTFWGQWIEEAGNVASGQSEGLSSVLFQLI